MYWNTWDQVVGEPGGSYATHPAHAIFHPISVAIAVVDIAAQVYTLFLMVHVAKKQLNEYRYFMMLCTTWDLCFAVTFGVLFQPRLHMPMSTCWSSRGLFSVFGNEGAKLAISSTFGFGAALIASQYYCLLFRITAVMVHSDMQRKFLSPQFTVFFLAVIATAACSIFCGIYVAAGFEPGDFDELLRILTEKEYFAADDTSIFCFNLYNVRAFGPADPTAIINTSTLSAKILGAIICAFMGFHVFFAGCGFWIIARLRRNSAQLSERTRQLQLQFVYLLLMQMLCPVVCMVVPACIPIAMATTGHYVTLVGIYVCLVGVSIFPLLNALLTIVFVTPYRAFTMKWIRFVLRIQWKPKVVPPPDPSSLQSNAGQPRISVRLVSARAA